MANYVQSNQTDYTPGSSLSCAFTSNNTAGNAIVVGFQYNVETGVATVSDTQGNSYSQIAAYTVGGVTALFLATNIKSGANTVTINLASSQSPGMIIVEYANVDTLDQAAVGSGSSNAISTPSITTTEANSTIVQLGNGSGAAWSTGSPYTQRQTLLLSGTGTFGALGDEDVSSTGTYSASATQGSMFGTSFACLLCNLYKAGTPPPPSNSKPNIFFIQ
jgi:hypothetical protein